MSADLLDRIADQIPSMLAYWDADLRCRYANQAYRTWFGIEPQALVGRTLPELLGPELYRLNRPHIEQALAGADDLGFGDAPDPAPFGREPDGFPVAKPVGGENLHCASSLMEADAPRQTASGSERLKLAPATASPMMVMTGPLNSLRS